MNGTQAIELHKIFKRHKFTDRETNQIIEFVENQNGDLLTKKDLRIEIEPLKRDIGLLKKDISWIKWVLGFVIALIIGLAGAVYYLHSNTKSDIREMRTEIREIKALIKSENK